MQGLSSSDPLSKRPFNGLRGHGHLPLFAQLLVRQPEHAVLPVCQRLLGADQVDQHPQPDHLSRALREVRQLGPPIGDRRNLCVSPPVLGIVIGAIRLRVVFHLLLGLPRPRVVPEVLILLVLPLVSAGGVVLIGPLVLVLVVRIVITGLVLLGLAFAFGLVPLMLAMVMSAWRRRLTFSRRLDRRGGTGRGLLHEVRAKATHFQVNLRRLLALAAFVVLVKEHHEVHVRHLVCHFAQTDLAIGNQIVRIQQLNVHEILDVLNREHELLVPPRVAEALLLRVGHAHRVPHREPNERISGLQVRVPPSKGFHDLNLDGVLRLFLLRRNIVDVRHVLQRRGRQFLLDQVAGGGDADRGRVPSDLAKPERAQDQMQPAALFGRVPETILRASAQHWNPSVIRFPSE
mmetsp:Transcript_33031/g.55294  ORF Transcript_33031/g.55294 Transcript_33031/m.55294 type:complete len:403 (-) Transcript_33031:699-1907(-)